MDAGRVSQERIVAIQALRFIAAIAVAGMHAEIFAFWLGQFVGVGLERPALAAIGNFGVDLFFVISGFVIVLSSEKLFGKAGAVRTFALRRIIRVVPLYWAGLLFVLLWSLRFPPAPDWQSMVHAMLFVPYASNTAHGRIVPPLEVGWTLNFEMLFYFVVALAMAKDASATVRRTAFILFLLVLAGSLLDLPQPLANWSSPIILELSGGTMLALIYRGGWQFQPRVRLCALALAASLLLSPLVMPGADMSGWLRVLFWGGGSWLLLAAMVLVPTRSGGSDARFWNFGGDISYVLYIVHMPVMMVSQMVLRHFRLPYGATEEAIFVVLVLVMSLVAAVIVHLLFERPLSQWLRSRVAPIA
ncbi:MAG: hypothetical protein C0491_13185 [Novosphingobium sp.]|nr:hypothetical protein [Novosphingobium sp.]